MNKSPILKSIAIAIALTGFSAAHADTLGKIKESGAVTMGVRESSGSLSYTLGDGKYAGYHVEICQRVLADIQKQLGLAKLDIKYQPVTSQNRIPLVQNGTVDIECGSTTNNAARQKDVAFAVDHLRRGSAHRGEGQLGHHLDRPAQRQEGRNHHRHDLGADAAQERARRTASTSTKSSARTTPTAFCCWSRAAPTPS